MTPQLKNLLIILGGIVVILIVVIVLFSGNSSFRKVMAVLLNEESPSGNMMRSKVNNSGQAAKQQSGPIVEMATLIRKIDDRMRIIESTGQEKLVDEYYELVFVTRKGQQISVECSAEAYAKIPFNQQGSLTYKKNMLVKFKIYEDTIYN